MSTLLILCLFLFNSILASPIDAASSRAANTFRVDATKTIYPLNFETIYHVNICNSYSTVIEPPPGYILQDVILGDSKLFKAEKTENRAIVKRLAPDNASTNLVLILQGEDKESHSLTFELSGAETPRISNVQFITPDQKAINPELEKAKVFYTNQLGLSLFEQEKKLSATIRERTLEKVETFQLDGDLSAEKLGVKLHLDAVLNSGGKGYVYIKTNMSDPDFQIVKLSGIQGKDLAKTVTLFRTTKDEHGTRYIYETTPFVKCDDCKKYTFFFKVYHENTQITAKVK